MIKKQVDNNAIVLFYECQPCYSSFLPNVATLDITRARFMVLSFKIIVTAIMQYNQGPCSSDNMGQVGVCLKDTEHFWLYKIINLPLSNYACAGRCARITIAASIYDHATKQQFPFYLHASFV